MRLSSLLGATCFTSAVFGAFDYNRAGGVLRAPAGDAFKTVTGTFTVPTLSGDSRLSIWVGIGDSTTQKYVLGGGILYNKTLSTWSAFFPSAATDTTSEVPVKSGDSIAVTVDIEVGAGGSVTIENKTQGKKATKTISAPTNASPSTLTALTADWWVQAYQVIPGELVKAPSYGTVSFTGCSATTQNGASVPITGAGTYEIQGTSGQMYSKTVVSSSGISVTGSDRPLKLRRASLE